MSTFRTLFMTLMLWSFLGFMAFMTLDTLYGPALLRYKNPLDLAAAWMYIVGLVSGGVLGTDLIWRLLWRG